MIKSKLSIKKGMPYPLGATACKSGINFAAVVYEREDSGWVLYDKKNPEEQIRIPFEESYFVGNICCIYIDNIHADRYEYLFYSGERYFADPYAKEIIGTGSFGLKPQDPTKGIRAGIPSGSFDWEDDEPLRIPYEDSVFYCMHVRGFTQNKKSGVKQKGTFLGVVEKLPYLKDLGIRNLELMPVYEFAEWPEERETTVPQETMAYAVAHFMDKPASDSENAREKRINYWGYKKACYFAPKAAYARRGKAIEDCKTLVRECHKSGIEVILQFYFPEDCKPGYILEVLRYWVLEYHIDGFHLMGTKIPLTLLATEPLFGNTKLIYYDFPYDEIYQGTEIPGYRNLASANDLFLKDARKYVKGDENMLGRMLQHVSGNSLKHGNLHYITNYCGFTLLDLVSYDRKHNEANGEDNRDGTDDNYSWNCGTEGPSRKAALRRLRKKQMKNAMTLVVLSQGTPFLTAGDEDGNSQLGNNNPYCQDNEIGWKDWQTTALAKEQYAFVKELLRFRREHAVFRKKGMAQNTDPKSCGFPEISFHSEEAFQLNTAGYNRHMAILYAGAYGDGNGNTDQDIYVIYNMHWISHRFALPKLENGYQWKLVMDTQEEDSFGVDCWKEDYTLAQGRSIQILVSEKQTEANTTSGQQAQ